MYDYNAIAWFVGSAVLIRLMYFKVDEWVGTLSAKYSQLPTFRKMYIQKNFIKSIVLAALTFIPVPKILYSICVHNYWDTYLIHRLAAIYVSNDFTGLVFVDKLPSTTKIHHIVTTILLFISLGLDFQHSDIGQAMFVYTVGSAAAYIVNFHLAIRWLWPNNQDKQLKLFSAAVYITTCLLTWSWHVYWAFTRPLFTGKHALYFLLLGWIVRDDIILMQWLTKD